MSEKELGDALLRLDALELAGTPDGRRQTWAVLERDRRRIRLLTVATGLAWAAGLAMVLWMLVAFGVLFPKQAQLKGDLERGVIGVAEAGRIQMANQVMFQMITLGVAASVGVMGLALLFTILLLFASRRATLRQINANLLAISEQLKQLRPS